MTLAAPKVVSYGTGATARATLTVTLPAGIVLGDLGTLLLSWSGSTAPSTPAGWTLAQATSSSAQGMSQYIYTRVFAAGDSGTVSATFAIGVRGSLILLVDSGTDGAPTFTTPVKQDTPSTTPVATGATTTVAGSYVRTLITYKGSSPTFADSIAPASGWTERVDVGSTSTSTYNIYGEVADQLEVSAGAVTGPTYMASPATPYITTTMVVAPYVAPAPPAVNPLAPALAFSYWPGPGRGEIPLTLDGLWDGNIKLPSHNGYVWLSDATHPLSPPVNPGPGPSASAVLAPSGLDGDGEQNVLDESPFLTPASYLAAPGVRPILEGADVGGVHRSLDGGVTWEPRPVVKVAGGGTTTMDNHIAAIRWDPNTAGKAFVLANTGVFKTTDFGDTWTKCPAPADGDGNGTYKVGGSEHPRPTGKMIVFNADSSVMWVSTISNGVRMSTDEGQNWTASAMSADHVRGLTFDPNDPTALLVAVHNGGAPSGGDATRNGVWRIANATTDMTGVARLGPASGAGSWGTVVGTVGAEEMSVDVNGATSTLWVAAYNAGIASYDGTSWALQNTGLNIEPHNIYAAIDLVREATGLTIVTGTVTTQGTQRTDGTKIVWRSTDGGASWSSLTHSAVAVVSVNDYGSQRPAFISKIGFEVFPSRAWLTLQIKIARDNHNRILIAGMGGCRIGELNATDGKWHWFPSTRGLMVSVNMFVAANPRDPGKMLLGSMDFTTFATSDGGVNFIPGGVQQAGGSTTGDCGAYDASPIAGQPCAAVVSTSDRSLVSYQPGNGVYFSADPNPATGTPVWQVVQFPDGSTARPLQTSGTFSGKYATCDVLGVTLGRTGPGGTQVILATVQNSGLWRKQGSAAWQLLTDAVCPTGTRPNRAFFQWVPNTATVFCHANSALWRSDSSGAQGSWLKVLDTDGISYLIVDTFRVDPNNPDYVYLSNGPNGLIQITNATTTTGTATTVSSKISTANVGPIVIYEPTGGLLVPCRDGRLLYCVSPQAATPVFVDVSNAFWQANSRNIRSIDCEVSGRILTATNGRGSIAGDPLGVPAALFPGYVDGKVLVGANTAGPSGLNIDAFDQLIYGATPTALHSAVRIFPGTLGFSTTSTYYQDLISAAIAKGRTPFIDMNMMKNDGTPPLYTWNQIANEPAGTATRIAIDAAIDTVINFCISKAPHPMLFSFNHEPENDSDLGQKAGTTTPAAQRPQYRAAFRYIVRRFRAAGVTNVSWGPVYINYTLTPKSTRNYTDWHPDRLDDAADGSQQWLTGTGKTALTDRVTDFIGYDRYNPDLPDATGNFPAAARNKSFTQDMNDINATMNAQVALGHGAQRQKVAIPELGLYWKTATLSADSTGTIPDGGVTLREYMSDMLTLGPKMGLFYVTFWGTAEGAFTSAPGDVKTNAWRAVTADSTVNGNLLTAGP